MVRAGSAPGAPITALHIGAQHTAVVSGCDAEPATTLVLAIGARKTARDFFRRSLPTPLEMENAIATVEDEVTRAVAVVARGSTLHGADPAVREIARLAGVASGGRGAPVTLVLEAMEQTFNRLVAVAEGRPARQEGLPDSAEFAAALLILREFMHHLRFDAITLPT
jgi:exopolyphosphatase/pppGpp-phosphohydrolase